MSTEPEKKEEADRNRTFDMYHVQSRIDLILLILFVVLFLLVVVLYKVFFAGGAA